MAKYRLTESRRRMIERYVNNRTQYLQREAAGELHEWEWPSLGDVYDGVAKGLSYAGNIPIIGKIPGAIGGGMQLAKGAYTGDKDMMMQGGANLVFSGVPGGGVVGKQIAKQGGKQIAKHIGNKTAQKIGGDALKIGTKNVVKAGIPTANKGGGGGAGGAVGGAVPNKFNLPGGGGSAAAAANIAQANPKQTKLQTMKSGGYIPQSQRG